MRRVGFIFAAVFIGLISVLGGIGIRSVVSEKLASPNDVVIPEETKIVYQPATFGSFLDSSEAGLDEDESSFLVFKNQFIAEKTDFVEVDLRKMKVGLWREGERVGEIPVLSKGRDGSWWETPTGKYSALTKEVNHFSSIGKVWMPWSIQFYGNFFIHGWPYYPDGTAVRPSYSGGCVRLSTEDAKSVFEFAGKGTPILVLDEPASVSSPAPELVRLAESDISAPDVSARAVLAADLDSGLVLLNKNADESLSVASLTKLMTSVTASELIYLGKSVRVLPSMLSDSFLGNIFTSNIFSPFTSAISLAVGENYTAFDLLYPLLMQSSNNTADVLASLLGEKNFVSQMNRKAKSLGMGSAVFADASGKSAENVASAKEMARLAKYILEKRKFLFDITKGEDFPVFGPNRFAGISNYNEFADDANLVGVKNGETRAAKQTLLTVWNLKARSGEEKNIAIVVLGSDNRRADTEKVLAWLNANFGLE